MQMNSMYAWLPSKMAAAELAAQRLGAKWTMRLGLPATQSAIAAAERDLGLLLPNSQKEFFKLHNGAFFGVVVPKYGAEDPFGVEVFSIDELVTYTTESRAIFARYDETGEAPFWRSLVAVGTSGGCGDLCLLDLEQPTAPDECVVLDGFNETPHLWRKRIIAGSFAQWLERMFDGLIVNGILPDYWAPVLVADMLVLPPPPGPDRTSSENPS
jgi:hypothetical protein